MWRRYLKPRSDIMLREFTTVDGERILESIAKENKLTSTTLAHIKAFLSGVFRYAKRQGVINSENPIRDVVLPKGKPARAKSLSFLGLDQSSGAGGVPSLATKN
jgi:hypothetical protein